MEELVKQAIISFEEILIPANYKQGTTIHRENETCKTIFIVKSGILRSYYLLNGRDITAHFATEHTIIGAIDSIVEGKKSNYSIEALEDSQVFLLKNADMEQYLDENHKLERLARQISQSLYFDLVQRMEGMTFLSAKEKYDRLLNRHPNLIQRVNLGHIASYLGITQETLSRIRSLS